MPQPQPKFTWLGHATLRVDLATGETIVIDPWLDGNPSCPPSHRPHADIIARAKRRVSTPRSPSSCNATFRRRETS